jgi:hypothetical protein
LNNFNLSEFWCAGFYSISKEIEIAKSAAIIKAKQQTKNILQANILQTLLAQKE